MANGYVKADSSNLKTMLLRFEEVTGKSMPHLVRAGARICAVELANRTQPFTVGSGAGKTALDRGKTNLKKDILKPVKDTEKLREKADGLRNEKMRTRMQAVVAAGSQPAIAALLAACKTILDPSHFKPAAGVPNIRTVHQSRRSKTTGRALSAAPDYNYAKTGLDSYVSQVARKIGYTKGGWSACAREIGGIKGDGARGIPAFAKRHKSENGQVLDQSANKSNPHFKLTNTTPWVSRLLNNSQQQKALDVAKSKMIKQLNSVLRHVAKNGKDVPATTAELIAETATD